MEYLLNFFEDLDEMVYISDMETNELVYMNRHLRNALGFENHAQYQGQMCYKVLQGYDQPCSFCTNHILEPNHFHSWTHINPVMNKRFLIKDSVFYYDDRKYRIEIAIDVDSEVVCQTPYYYARSESILNGCLQQAFSDASPEAALGQILSYVGRTFSCDRVYIFELDGDSANNTYEWCDPSAAPQQEILQNLPISFISWWIDLFEKNELVMIRDLEEIRTEYPAAYAVLKPQKIERLAAGPILSDGKLVGFFGVDNPDPDMMGLIASLLKMIGYFVISLLRRRDLLKHLNTLSFHDPLTGAYNRNALFEHNTFADKCKTMGVVYCDITGLKQVNDSMGHDAGDLLIRHSYQLIRNELDTPWVYRTGGDEFVAVFPDIEQEAFWTKVSDLHAAVHKSKQHIAVGYAWCGEQPFSVEAMISRADKVMYQDKRDYYAANRMLPGVERRREADRVPVLAHDGDSLFYNFLHTTYYDAEMVFRSISQQNTTAYFYFGDMQKNIFYVSDNMRDEFGFQSNIVPGLLQAWAQRITSVKYRDMYWEELDSMIKEKRSIHDLRYQVRDTNGKSMWVRCYGVLKWNEDKTLPLFFSGRVSHQDDAFVIDPVTNFPREQALLSYLDEVKGKKSTALAIGFSFNSIAEINSTRGRTYSDHLVENIATDLMEKLSDKMSFYRLEGMRCAAILDAGCTESREELVEQIRAIVDSWYHLMGISLQHTCSFAVMEYPQSNLMPADFLEQLVSLIRVAKHDTKQLYAGYSESNIERVKYMSNMALALSRDVLCGMENFRIVIQPIVSTLNGRAIGGEVLLRWKFGGKDVSPAVFVPMLEKDNMIHLAGRWVFEQAVCACMRLVSYDPEFYLSFNVSLYQLSDSHFLDFMEETLGKYQVDGCHLVAEMTESCMDEKPEKLLHFVTVCRKLGIRIALDDFGSGYSSLRMLLQYPTNIIKLDRSLLGEMVESADKMNFISSIVYACHRFGKMVCMEGVETAEENTLIRESGCDLIQGYYYHKPMELNDVYRLLASESGAGSAGL